MPLSLSDDELMAVIEAARPIEPRDSEFLRDVASELAQYQELLAMKMPKKNVRRGR